MVGTWEAAPDLVKVRGKLEPRVIERDLQRGGIHGQGQGAEREVGAAGKQGAMEEAQEIGSPPYQGQRHPTSAPSQGQRDVVTCARSRHELGPETRSAFGISFTAARLISS
jgi:hypothetical protein